MSENKGMVVDGVYLHIGNGGVTFKVTNEHGPTIEVSAGHFGHETNKIRLSVTRETLFKLAEMFHEAAEYEGYGEDYFCAPELMGLSKETGKSVRLDGSVNVTGGNSMQ